MASKAPRESKASTAQFIALLRALGMVVDSYNVSHAQLERMLCERIAAGRVAEERLRGLPRGSDQSELLRLVARRTAVEESGLARADGRREKAGGQRIGELLAGKFPKNAMPPRRRVEVCVDVLLEVLEAKDPRGYAEDRYGNRDLWFELWLQADQGKLPALGERARTVTGYLDVARQQLAAAGHDHGPVPALAADDAERRPDAAAPGEHEPAADPAPGPAAEPAADLAPGPAAEPAADLAPGPAAEPAPGPAAEPVAEREAARRGRPGMARLVAGAVALVVITAGLVVVLAAVLGPGPAGPSVGEVVLQVPAPYALAPGPSGVTIPLDLTGAGHQTNWALTLRLRLASTSLADACVHDSQLAYTLRNNGTVVSRGPLGPGRSQVTAGPLRLGDIGAGHRLQLIVTVTVGQVDAGCQFTLDPSGTSAHATG